MAVILHFRLIFGSRIFWWENKWYCLLILFYFCTSYKTTRSCDFSMEYNSQYFNWNKLLDQCYCVVFTEIDNRLLFELFYREIDFSLWQVNHPKVGIPKQFAMLHKSRAFLCMILHASKIKISLVRPEDASWSSPWFIKLYN